MKRRKAIIGETEIQIRQNRFHGLFNIVYGEDRSGEKNMEEIFALQFTSNRMRVLINFLIIVQLRIIGLLFNVLIRICYLLTTSTNTGTLAGCAT